MTKSELDKLEEELHNTMLSNIMVCAGDKTPETANFVEMFNRFGGHDIKLHMRRFKENELDKRTALILVSRPFPSREYYLNKTKKERKDLHKSLSGYLHQFDQMKLNENVKDVMFLGGFRTKRVLDFARANPEIRCWSLGYIAQTLLVIPKLHLSPENIELDFESFRDRRKKGAPIGNDHAHFLNYVTPNRSFKNTQKNRLYIPKVIRQFRETINTLDVQKQAKQESSRRNFLGVASAWPHLGVTVSPVALDIPKPQRKTYSIPEEWWCDFAEPRVLPSRPADAKDPLPDLPSKDHRQASDLSDQGSCLDSNSGVSPSPEDWLEVVAALEQSEGNDFTEVNETADQRSRSPKRQQRR